jgi:hypothetical protein
LGHYGSRIGWLANGFHQPRRSSLFGCYPQPEIVAIDLIDAANQIVSLAQESLQSEC